MSYLRAKDDRINPENSKDSFWMRMFDAQHVDLSKRLGFFPTPEKHTNQALIITPKIAFGTSEALKLCRVFVVWEKNQGKVAFTCFNPVDGLGKNGLIRGRIVFGPQRSSGMVELSNPWMSLFIKGFIVGF